MFNYANIMIEDKNHYKQQQINSYNHQETKILFSKNVIIEDEIIVDIVFITFF